MTDPTPTPAALPDDLARLLNAASALVQRAHSIGGHAVADLDALRAALAPARRAAEGLAGRVEAKQRGADMLRECLEIEYAGRKDAEAERGLSEMRAARWKAAAKTLRRRAEENHARAERLRAELVAGQAREAALALLVERLVGALQAALGTDAEWWVQAQEALTLAPAPDAMPAALLAAARAVLAETTAREGLRLALRHEAPAGGLAPAMQAYEEAERALSRAADALRAAGIAGEGE